MTGKLLHVALAGTMQGLVGKQFCSSLMAETFQLARRRGFAGIYAGCTSKTSRHILERLGSRELCRVTYRGFEFQGKKPFSQIGPEEVGSACVLLRHIFSS